MGDYGQNLQRDTEEIENQDWNEREQSEDDVPFLTISTEQPTARKSVVSPKHIEHIFNHFIGWRRSYLSWGTHVGPCPQKRDQMLQLVGHIGFIRSSEQNIRAHLEKWNETKPAKANVISVMDGNFGKRLVTGGHENLSLSSRASRNHGLMGRAWVTEGLQWLQGWSDRWTWIFLHMGALGIITFLMIACLGSRFVHEQIRRHAVCAHDRMTLCKRTTIRLSDGQRSYNLPYWFKHRAVAFFTLYCLCCTSTRQFNGTRLTSIHSYSVTVLRTNSTHVTI